VEKKADESVRVPKERVPFEELPRSLQKKIEKRTKKRDELKIQRKLKVDWSKPDDVILERYKLVFPD